MSNTSTVRARFPGRSAFRGLRRPSIAVGILAVTSSLVAASAVSASSIAKTAAPNSRSHSASTVKPDIAYYKGKTINMYTYASPGQAVDLEERVLAPYIAAYLHCQVVVHNVSGGGSLPGQNLAATAPADGLTMGQANLVGDIGDFVNNVAGLEFSIRSIPYLEGLGSLDYVQVVSPSSGYKTYSDLVNSKAPVTTLYAVDSTAGVYTELVNGAFHVNVKYITGYPGAAQVLTGFVRGDGVSLFNAYSSLLALVSGGQAVPLMQSNPAEKGESGYALMRKVPVMSAYAAAHPPKTADAKAELKVAEDLLFLASPFFVPLGTPAKYQAALNAAILWAATRGGAKTQLVNDGLPVATQSPSQVRTAVDAVIKDQTKLQSWLTPGA